MPDRSRWDPEMAAFTEMMDKEAAKYPPVRAAFPFEPNRRVNDILGMVTAAADRRWRSGWTASSTHAAGASSAASSAR